MTANVKKKTEWIKGLKELLKEYDDNNVNTIPLDERKGYMDNSQIAMIIPKTVEFKELLLSTFDVKESRIPVTDYTIQSIETGMELKSNYCITYLNIFYMMSKQYTHCIMKFKIDGILTLEVDDFIFLLAPRTEN